LVDRRNDMSSPADLRPDWLALTGAAVTATLNLVLPSGWPTAGFIAASCIFWAVFVIARARRHPNVLHDWGFRIDNLAAASMASAVVFALTATAFAVYAHLHGTLRFPPHTLFLLLLYPVYGVVQQFLALAVVVGNLECVRPFRRRRWLVIPIGAALFGVAHVFDMRLVAATFLLELVVIPLYLWRRNLWAYGVLHGWLGALFWLWVLGRDQWAENFGH
jgi:hypothetical protein